MSKGANCKCTVPGVPCTVPLEMRQKFKFKQHYTAVHCRFLHLQFGVNKYLQAIWLHPWIKPIFKHQIHSISYPFTSPILGTRIVCSARLFTSALNMSFKHKLVNIKTPKALYKLWFSTSVNDSHSHLNTSVLRAEVYVQWDT